MSDFTIKKQWSLLKDAATKSQILTFLELFIQVMRVMVSKYVMVYINSAINWHSINNSGGNS